MAIRKYVDHMITLAKDGSLHARRQVRGCAGRDRGWRWGPKRAVYEIMSSVKVRCLHSSLISFRALIVQALAFIFDKDLVANLFQSAPERYGERPGGYTRVKPDPVLRRGDATEMAVIELV